MMPPHLEWMVYAYVCDVDCKMDVQCNGKHEWLWIGRMGGQLIRITVIKFCFAW